MKKSKKSICKDMSFTINKNEIALNSRKFKTEEISRGTGVHRPKKGKGSYTRKRKYKEDYSSDSLTGIFYFNISKRAM